jgi:hypothetical protein
VRPGIPCLEHAGRTERDSDEVGQRRILLRIDGDEQVIWHIPTMGDIWEEIHRREC